MTWQSVVASRVKDLAPQAGKAAMNAAKNVATDKMMKSFAEGGMAKFSSARQTRSEQAAQRDKALVLARQVHGQLTHSYVDETDDLHWIVWKNGAPFRAFPKLEGDLAERDELAHIEGSDLQTPDDVEAEAKRIRRRLGRKRSATEVETEDPPAPESGG